MGRGQRAIHKRIIYHVIEWSILVDAATERTENAFTLRIIPNFGSDVCRQVNAVLTGARIPPLLAGRRLELTELTVIKNHKILIKSNRGSVLANGWQAAGCHCERKFPQRRKLVPLFRRIAQDPFDSGCIVIETDDKVFAA